MRKLIRRFPILALLVSISLATSPGGTVSARQQAPKVTTEVVVTPALSSGSGTNYGEGFDTCSLPTTSQMVNFYDGTPYYWYNVYIGGENYGCRPATVTSSWLNTVSAEGWQFIFNWVGLQSPCSTQNVTKFSTNTTMAYKQGTSDAASAWDVLINLGITNEAQGTVIVFDLDSAPDQGNPSCLAATNSFIQGWVDTLNTSPAQVPGVYGSVCGSNLVALASLSRPPSFIWGAYWDGNLSTSDLDPSCGGGYSGIPSGDWSNHQRFKQYQGAHYQTYNGTTLDIDSD